MIENHSTQPKIGSQFGAEFDAESGSKSTIFSARKTGTNQEGFEVEGC